MKRTIKRILSIVIPLLGLVFLSSCYYDEPPELTLNLPEPVSFTVHIVPIFSASCSVAGCHDGTISPNLTADNAYNELVRGGYISTVFPEQGVLYQEISTNAMPPGGPLTAMQKALIIKWLETGALNN